MKSISSFIKRYSVHLFLILTPLISLSISLFLSLPPDAVPLLMVFVPALMAILLIAITEGRKSVVVLIKQLFNWRISIKWYAISIGLAVGVRLSIGLLALLAGWIPFIQFREWSPQQFLLIGVFALVGACMEELGWRGYALPRLMAHRSALLSALIIAVPWAILHLGLTLPGMMNAGTSWLATILQITGLSVIVTWLFVQTRGNLLIIILYHAGQNFFVFLTGGITQVQDLGLLTAATLGVAMILILLYGPDLQRNPMKEPAHADAG